MTTISTVKEALARLSSFNPGALLKVDGRTMEVANVQGIKVLRTIPTHNTITIEKPHDGRWYKASGGKSTHGRIINVLEA